MKGILREIIENKRREVEERQRIRPLDDLKPAAAAAPPARDFRSDLRRGGGPLKLLAEIKAASPSAGVIRADFDAAEIARLYERAGASAISVLTDAKYFSGSDEHLQAARAAVSLPVLRKDFTLGEYQLYESRILGADAVLLMAQVLDREIFAALLQKARELGLYVLAEGHTAEQIQFIVDVGAEVIGINNRDFETLTTDIETTLNLIHLVPEDRIVVSQSGIFLREEAQRLEAAGVDAIQVGTSIMKEEDMEEQLRRLLGR
ncbi:MAG: indole-3-glycerol phosphate synthase TrpC [Candidatus Omnitrophota bacterium]